MTKLLSWMLTGCLALVLGASLVWAAPSGPEGPPETELKPIVVLGIAGYDELHSDLEFLGKLSGNPELAQSLDGLIAILTQFQGLNGLDKTRPLGGVLAHDGTAIQVLTFVPVSSAEKLLGALSKTIGQPEKLEDKTWRLNLDGTDVFIKESHGWAFVAQTEASLNHLPKDPLKLLAGLTDEYDFAARVNVQNVPQEYRDMAIDQIKVGMEGGMSRRDDETEAEFKDRTEVMRHQMESIVAMINELNQLTLGYAVDPKNRRAFIDLTMTSIAKGRLAKAFASMADVKSELTGFLAPDALIRAHFASRISEEEIPMWIDLIGEMQEQIHDEIGRDDDLDEQGKTVAKGMVDELHDLAVETVKQGRLDGGFLAVGEGPFSGVWGLHVADGKKLDDLFKRAIDMAKTAHADEPKQPEITLNFETYKGATIHKILTPEENDDDFEKIFGAKKAELYFAFGPEFVLAGMGPESLKTLKSIVDKAAAGPVAPELPMQASVSLGPILRFAAKQNPDDPGLALVVSAIEGEKHDRINLTAKPIPQGVTYRLELEEGVLKLFPSMAQLP